MTGSGLFLLAASIMHRCIEKKSQYLDLVSSSRSETVGKQCVRALQSAAHWEKVLPSLLNEEVSVTITLLHD